MATELSAEALGELIGVSARTVRDLATRGIVVKRGQGAYDAAESVKAYCDHLREVAAGRGGEEGVLDLTKERARLAKEQADGVALKNEQLRGELVPAAAVEREWANVLSFVRARMLAVTNDVAQALPHLTKHDADVIDRTVRAALDEASRDDSQT